MPGATHLPKTNPEQAASAPSQLTEEEFRRWKAAHLDEQGKSDAVDQEAQRRADIAAGIVSIEEMTGRELAEHHPELFDGY